MPPVFPSGAVGAGLGDVIEDVVRSAGRLAAAAAGLSGAAVREPSGLPDWTRGRVLAHVAYSADAYTWLLELARTGREPGPRADPARAARDAVLPAEPPAERLRASLGRFTDGARALPAPAWERLVPALAGWRHPAWYLLLRALVQRVRRRAADHHHRRRRGPARRRVLHPAGPVAARRRPLRREHHGHRPGTRHRPAARLGRQGLSRPADLRAAPAPAP